MICTRNVVRNVTWCTHTDLGRREAPRGCSVHNIYIYNITETKITKEHVRTLRDVNLSVNRAENVEMFNCERDFNAKMP